MVYNDIQEPNSSQDDSLSFLAPTPDFVEKGHLDKKNYILERQALYKSFSLRWVNLSWDDLSALY